MRNYDNVISQIQAHGLILKNGRLEIGRLVRCPVQGDREKRARLVRRSPRHHQRG